MKNPILIFFVAAVMLLSCKKDNDTGDVESNPACNGAACSPDLLSDETAATLPSSLLGTYQTTYDYAQPGSPFSDGLKATFTLTSDNELIVELEGEECIVLRNPAFRQGINESNFFFKDNCDRNICYNVSQNMEGSFNEVNVQPYQGIGWHGQFAISE